ncbi:MAG: branched chain amino acid ABC transporter substrate-binding protein, partial [Desulfuromonas sp.]
MLTFSWGAVIRSLLLILLFGSISCAVAAPLKVGVAGAHSGDLAPYGLPTLDAARMAVEAQNLAGGVLGQPVQLLTLDDQCKPEIATNVATRLVSENVDVVIGHICSGATKAALGIYQEAGVLVISPSATETELTRSGKSP